MKIALVAILILTSAFSAHASVNASDLWADVEKTVEQTVKSKQLELSKRAAIEADSYFLGRTLAYRYEFRKRVGGSIDDAYTEKFFEYYFFADPEFRDSYISWLILFGHGLLSPIYDGERSGHFTFESNWMHRLQISEGFVKGVDSISTQVGTDLLPIVLRDMTVASDQSSIATQLVGLFGLFKVTGRIMAIAERLKLFKPLLVRLTRMGIGRFERRMAVATVGVVAVAPQIYAAIADRKEHETYEQQLQTSVGDASQPTIFNAKVDTWMLRDQSVVGFAKRYYDWADTRSEMPQTLLDEEHALLQHKSEFAERKADLEAKLKSKDIDAPKISAIIAAKTQGVAQSAENLEALRDAIVIGSIDLLFRQDH